MTNNQINNNLNNFNNNNNVYPSDQNQKNINNKNTSQNPLKIDDKKQEDTKQEDKTYISKDESTSVDKEQESQKDANEENSSNISSFKKAFNMVKNIFNSEVIKTILIAALVVFLFFLAILYLPKRLSFSNVGYKQKYKVEYANADYFAGYQTIAESTNTLCSELLGLWNTSSQEATYNIQLKLIRDFKEVSLNIVALDPKNKFILSNSENLSEDIKTYYISSNNMIETGDILIGKMTEDSELANNINPYNTLINLNSFVKVGIMSNVHSDTWDKIISCKFIPVIYDNLENLINDILSEKIKYAIGPRLQTLQAIDILEEIDRISCSKKVLHSEGPVLLISKDIENAYAIIASFNNMLIEIVKRKSMKIPLSQNYSVNIFPENSLPNDSFA